MPHYDVIALNENNKPLAVQVKTTNRGSWQFDARYFMQIELIGTKQRVGEGKPAPYPSLLFVFVRLSDQEPANFYVLTWASLQKIAMRHYQWNLDHHQGVRPKRHDSFHMGILPEYLQDHRDRWDSMHDLLS